MRHHPRPAASAAQNAAAAPGPRSAPARGRHDPHRLEVRPGLHDAVVLEVGAQRVPDPPGPGGRGPGSDRAGAAAGGGGAAVGDGGVGLGAEGSERGGWGGGGGGVGWDGVWV